MSLRINPAIVRAYDLRGIARDQLRLEDAWLLGFAYATVARSRGLLRIAVGRDGRLTSPELEAGLIAGLTAGGMHVHRIGLGPTPQVYFAVRALGLDGGIMVTASHNPSDHNGFKVLLGTEPVYGVQLQTLVATEPQSAPGGCVQEMSVTEAYIQRLAALGAGMRDMKVVWDCGNGSVGAVIDELTSRLPGRHVLLNVEVDGRFPAHHPDPSVAENLYQLQLAVREEGADLGIAFDGDGDRIGIVDENGAIFDSDHLLLLLATDVLAQQPGAAIVADVKCSSVLFDGILRRGGRPIMAPSGYVHVRDAMLRERAPLAGEMSGHIFFADCWCRTDDALYVAVRTLGALTRQRCTIESFRASLPATASTSEIRISCPEERKSAVVREIGERVATSGAIVNCVDGIRVTTENGWWLLRASGTESKLTVRCEAGDPHALERLCREVIGHLELSGVPSASEITAATRPWRSGERSNL